MHYNACVIYSVSDSVDTEVSLRRITTSLSGAGYHSKRSQSYANWMKNGSSKGRPAHTIIVIVITASYSTQRPFLCDLLAFMWLAKLAIRSIYTFLMKSSITYIFKTFVLTCNMNLQHSNSIVKSLATLTGHM